MVAPAIDPAAMLAQLEALATAYRDKRKRLELRASEMSKPGEMTTKRELERRARDFSSVVFKIDDAIRALKAHPLPKERADG